MHDVSTKPSDTGGVKAEATMSWSRAIVLGSVAFVVVVVLFFYVPQFLLTGVTAIPRAARAWLATGWTLAALALCAWIGWRSASARPRA